MPPPAVYLQSVPEPYCAIKTNGDLVDCLVVTRAALKKSNLDKEALREWAAEVEPPVPPKQ